MKQDYRWQWTGVRGKSDGIIVWRKTVTKIFLIQWVCTKIKVVFTPPLLLQKCILSNIIQAQLFVLMAKSKCVLFYTLIHAYRRQERWPLVGLFDCSSSSAHPTPGLTLLISSPAACRCKPDSHQVHISASACICLPVNCLSPLLPATTSVPVGLTHRRLVCLAGARTSRFVVTQVSCAVNFCLLCLRLRKTKHNASAFYQTKKG